MLRWECVHISFGRLLKIGKYKVDSRERQSNLLFSWEAIKITAKLVSPPQTWTEEELQRATEFVPTSSWDRERGNFTSEVLLRLLLFSADMHMLLTMLSISEPSAGPARLCAELQQFVCVSSEWVSARLYSVSPERRQATPLTEIGSRGHPSHKHGYYNQPRKALSQQFWEKGMWESILYLCCNKNVR